MVWRLSMKWRAEVDRRLAPLDLTHAQYSLLASLYGLTWAGARPSQRELADFAGLEPIYVSKLVKALERDGLLRRSVSQADSRAVELELTEGGQARILDAMVVVRGFLDDALAPIGGPDGEQNQVFMRLLEALLTGPMKGD
jgi:DNA-binding MarR family transcriptional regulator